MNIYIFKGQVFCQAKGLVLNPDLERNRKRKEVATNCLIPSQSTEYPFSSKV